VGCQRCEIEDKVESDRNESGNCSFDGQVPAHILVTKGWGFIVVMAGRKNLYVHCERISGVKNASFRGAS
jgi:hypothetical protein